MNVTGTRSVVPNFSEIPCIILIFVNLATPNDRDVIKGIRASHIGLRLVLDMMVITLFDQLNPPR